MLKERLTYDLKDAMRAKDVVRLAAIRSVLSAITAREKEGSGPLSSDDLLGVVSKQAKQRRDSIEQFDNAGRVDLAQRERDELVIIERYLPAQVSDAEILRVVQDFITRSGATSHKDMGRVMGEAMRELKGVADGTRIRQTVEQTLNP
jgi:uncharacterized protein